MLRQISEPLALSEASVLVLRPALNAPVLNVEFLPVGPARAAIVIFAEEYGGIGLALGIRSTEGGQVAVFRNREPLDEVAPLENALEPALTWAERIGFLFDEDMVESTPAGRSEATALWGRLMGDVAMPPPPKAARPLPAATEPILELTDSVVAPDGLPELAREDVALAEPPQPKLESKPGALPPASGVPLEKEVAVEPRAASSVTENLIDTRPELDLEVEPKANREESSKSLPLEVPATLLSKFRQSEDDVDSATPSTRGESPSVLGRTPIVRMRRSSDTVKQIPYLARLLSSF